MKILVFSDSHSSLSFMRTCLAAVKPDAVIHLGDHYDDGEVLKEEYPGIPLYQVPGNCDRYRVPGFVPEILIRPVFGVNFYMTHGHKHNVKFSLDLLLADARKAGVKAVLYGHTHIPDCHRESDGLWVVNPGSCGHAGGGAAVIETESGEIAACYLVNQRDLEDMP